MVLERDPLLPGVGQHWPLGPSQHSTSPDPTYSGGGAPDQGQSGMPSSQSFGILGPHSQGLGISVQETALSPPILVIRLEGNALLVDADPTLPLMCCAIWGKLWNLSVPFLIC